MWRDNWKCQRQRERINRTRKLLWTTGKLEMKEHLNYSRRIMAKTVGKTEAGVIEVERTNTTGQGRKEQTWWKGTQDRERDRERERIKAWENEEGGGRINLYSIMIRYQKLVLWSGEQKADHIKQMRRSPHLLNKLDKHHLWICIYSCIYSGLLSCFSQPTLQELQTFWKPD